VRQRAIEFLKIVPATDKTAQHVSLVTSGHLALNKRFGEIAAYDAHKTSESILVDPCFAQVLADAS
jgi:hypothetical protein